MLLLGQMLILTAGAVACAALVPGYAEEKARLEQQADEARAARQAAEAQLAAATKAQDAQGVAAALDALSRSIQGQIEALSARAKHEVESAKDAGVGITEVVAGLFGAGGLVGSILAQRKASQAVNGPSRAQNEVDQQWDQIASLRAELAGLQASVGAPAPAPPALPVPKPFA